MKKLLALLFMTIFSSPVFAYYNYNDHNTWQKNTSSTNQWLQQRNNYYQQQEQEARIEAIERRQQTENYIRRQQDMDNRYKQQFMNKKMF